ncbi:response regulator [Candidatus Gracilibacteria bacterium]|nr:response regulator [Candidatus Gracilibacteria bacterium]
MKGLNERLRMHVRDTPLGYIEWDRNLQVRVWNGAAERIFGYAEDEVRGRMVRELIVPRRLWPMIDQLHHQLEQQSGGRRSTNVNCTRDGREIICEWYNTVFVDAGGTVTGWASLVEDITDRTRTEAALAQANHNLHARVDELIALSRITQTIVSEPSLTAILAIVAERITSLLDVAASAIVLQGQEPHLLRIVAQYSRNPAVNLIGTSVPRDVVPPALLDALTRRSILLAQADVVTLAPLFGLDPTAAYCSGVMLTPLLMHNTLQGCIVVTSDRADELHEPAVARLVETIAGQLSGVIERARLLELAELAREAAEAASRAKSHFLASMSHELRTPLHAILGYTQLLQRNGFDAALQSDALRQIEQSGDHLLALITDLLDLAKIEAGTVLLTEDVVYLAALLNDIAASARLQAQHKGLNFTFAINPNPAAEFIELPTTVLADARRLRQILLNLLSNAIKFTDSGDVALSVSFAPAPTGEGRWSLRFQIDDTGVGIAADDLPRITEPFQQASTAERRVDGAGLGLAICVELLRLMGSELKMSSAHGHGSSFWFTLVLTEGPNEYTSTAGATTLASLRVNGTGRRVLIVDDDTISRRLLKSILESSGFTVLEASDGEEGLSLAQTAHPDLLIVDALMPRLNGSELIASLRQQPAFRRTIMVTISANVTEAQQRESSEAGSDLFLMKPLNIDHLLVTIDQLLSASTDQSRWPAAHLALPSALVWPSLRELAELHNLVVVGDLRALMQRTTELAAAHAELVPFAREVQRSAEAFQLDALHALFTIARRDAAKVYEVTDEHYG